ncbi:MAG: serine/threonine protein kinase [Burkholderiaceae bacterium]|nr:serine/threonine protein kinase [Burkholderiaceae bacterium]
MSDSPGFWRRLLGRAQAPAVVPSRPEPPAAAEPLAADAAPAMGLARYRRDGELGRGSMGAVYLATDLQSGRQVALKLLSLQREFSPEDLAEVRQRFLRESRAASSLHHPDILEVLDSGEAGPDAWIVMELVQGQDLSAYSRSGQLLPVSQVLKITARLARALAYAHRQGVVHRDIKPANVLVDPAQDSVKLSDFGIARIADGSRTRTGLVLGTPSFMSPEQLAGLRVDGRSDLYSLGVLLFQMLTGQLPHQAESMARLMNAIANEPAADVRSLRPQLPEALAMVVALALEKRPELRYSNGDQFADDLDAVARQFTEATPGLDLDLAGTPSPGAQTLHAEDQNVDAFAQTQALDARDPRHNP